MDKKTQFGFIHRFIPSKNKGGGAKTTRTSEQGSNGKMFTTFLLLHGTGGNEEDLVPLAYELDQRAAILTPRGKVLENGVAPRFFRRLAEATLFNSLK
jgi:phospholipase/carboxylesterase